MVDEFELLQLASFLKQKKNRSVILYMKGDIQEVKQQAQDFHNWAKKYGVEKKILYTYLEDFETIKCSVQLNTMYDKYSVVLTNAMESLSELGYQSFLLDILQVGKEIIDIRNYDFSDVYYKDVFFEYEEFAFGMTIEEFFATDENTYEDNVVYVPFRTNSLDM